MSAKKHPLPGITEADVQAVRIAARAVVKEHAKSPEAARAYLRRLGIITPTGKLKRVYAG